MISQALEYSLRAMVLLAGAGGKPMTVNEIAEIARIPAPYLSKIMRGLVRSELVESRRGVGGGFLLTRNPKQITVWDVVQAVDPIKRITSCPLNIPCHVTLCPLHRRIDDVLGLVEHAFRSTALTDLLAEQPGSSPLCSDQPRPVPLMPLGGVRSEE